MTCRALTLPLNAEPAAIAERGPTRAVPDREEVSVGVTPGVGEGAAGVTLPAWNSIAKTSPLSDEEGPRAPQVLPSQVAMRSALALPPALVNPPPM